MNLYISGIVATGLLLNGPNKGKLVNLEMAADQKTAFAPDTNFLD